MNSETYMKNIKTLLLILSLSLSASGYAETLSRTAVNTKSKTVKPVAQAAFIPYNYAYPGPAYGRPYYPLNRQGYNNRNSHRFNGRNDWFGDNRMHQWNRVVSDMVSDMFGSSAGDFEFDVKIKFKADGKGKGRGKSRANARTNQRYGGYYQGNYQGRGNYYGRGNNYQYSTYGRYGYTPYPPYSTYPSPGAYTTYQSYPPVTGIAEQKTNSVSK